MIAGEIPPELGELSNLTVFGAAATAVSGEIPPELGKLKLLQTLSIYNTAVSGAIPKELGSLSELRNLYLHLNRLKGNIPPELGNLQKLNSLLLWGNTITGMIPRELGNCSSLVVLDLSGNEISGEIPGELGKLSLLEQLHLSENSISGVIPVELVTNCRSLTTLQLDNNEISGEIPEEIGRLKSLQLLFLWGNSLWGKIPRALGNCSELYSLDLSKNKLSGDIPGEIFELKKLSKLLLLGNSFTGELPGSLGSCQSLVRLRLGENRLSGQIPTEIGQLNNLVFLDLFSNNFTGRLPQEIGSMSLLEMLDIHDNQLEGEIPFEIGRLVNLEQLDLGGNAFSGEIPTSIGNLNYLNKLVLCKNWLTGELPKSLGNLKRLTLLDLSFNLISGAIPAEIGSLTSLTISLTLSSNNLTGQLPREMARLTQLQSLDLSVNNISGGIAVLGALTSLTSLNISDNNFSGPIPVNPFFKTASPRSYSGNPGLCQSSDGLTCSADVIRRTTIRTIKKAALVCVIIGSITVAVLATWMLFSRGRYAAAASPPLPVSGEDDFSHPWTFTPFQKFSFTVDEILACIKVENVIGKGCSGAVYRAEMPGGDIIAVKKLWKLRPDDPPANFFESEIEILGRIRHRNIVRLLGYCSNRSVKLLLYNFIPNGNLQQLLRENRNLDWETRYRIALGAAQGLSYLHHDCVPPILHRDVKCNNILLDSKYEACIADFGLAKSMGRPTGISRIAGSYGYIAPGKFKISSFSLFHFYLAHLKYRFVDVEYGYTTNITEKSDVYSYGVVLLEILSGRSAVGEGEGLHIVEWARKKMGDFELAVHLLDDKLRDLPEQSVQEMLQTLGVAMFCVNSGPSDRPTMKEVVALLTEVRSPPEEWGGKISQQPLIKYPVRGSS